MRKIKVVLLLIIVVCLIPIGQSCYLSVKHRKQQEELSSSLKQQNTLQKGTAQQDPVTEAVAEKNVLEEPEMLEKFKELYAENSDLTGWLAIEGTDIDYPVVQCEDDDYYLSHNFYREKDKYGCLYVKNIADVNTPGTNFIIYGHNMKDGSMFGDLEKYENETFFREHSRISFDTLYEERTYEVMAVFQSQIYAAEENVFKYYEFYQADSEEEFQDFYENVMKMALYDTGVTADFGDTFLMLSTCSYHVEDGRLVVVAKRVN